MISEVRFENFKALRDVRTSLGRFCVFVGPNASGKTSLLEGINYVAQAIHDDPQSIFTGPRAPGVLYRRDSSDLLGFFCQSGIAQFRLSVWPDFSQSQVDREAMLNDGWQFVSSSGDGEWAYRRQARCLPVEGGPEWKPWNSARHETRQILAECGGAVLLRFEASRLAAPSYIAQEIPRIESDGEGLATTLLHLKANSDDAFARLESELREMVPTVRKIRFAKARVYRREVDVLERGGKRTPIPTEREYTGDVLAFDTASGTHIPAALMSEGTLLLLGMLTVLHSPQQPRLVLIDDLDRALHPRVQRTLVDLLHRWLDTRHDVQIAATSHSPYLLDALRPEEVRLTTLDDHGDVVCAALKQHPQFTKWSAEMSPGEFWSAVGEDWVREQAQAHAGAAS